MRPGQIRVFDGLRVTTEHVDHFQASLHSAIQDIRSILGLGMVYAGLDVAATGPNTITVQPGLAFDFQKNRIVSDELQTLEVSFEPNQNTAFVCAKYDQIEGGETEGRSTLLWDGCSLVVRPTLPDARENLLPLARLIRNTDGAITVRDLTRPEPDPSTAPSAEAETTSSEGTSGSAATMSAASVPQASLKIRQGVLRLPADARVDPYLILVSSVVMAAAQPIPAGGDLVMPLAATELPLGFAWTTVTCYAVMSATVNVPQAPAQPGADSSTGAPTRADITIHSTASGEATRMDQGIAQFGLSTIENAPPDLTEGVVGSLPLGAVAGGGQIAVPPGVTELLSHARVSIRIEPSGETALKVVCNLVWAGGMSEQLLRQLEEHKAGLTWKSQLAWKAIGRSTS